MLLLLPEMVPLTNFRLEPNKASATRVSHPGRDQWRKWGETSIITTSNVVAHAYMCDGNFPESVRCAWLKQCRGFISVCTGKCGREPVIDGPAVYTLTVKPSSVLWLAGWLIACSELEPIISSISDCCWMHTQRRTCLCNEACMTRCNITVMW